MCPERLTQVIMTERNGEEKIIGQMIKNVTKKIVDTHPYILRQ